MSDVRLIEPDRVVALTPALTVVLPPASQIELHPTGMWWWWWSSIEEALTNRDEKTGKLAPDMLVLTRLLALGLDMGLG